MINYDENTIIKAIQQFGANEQSLVAVEEMSELQKEILKNINRGENNRDQIKEELVDVLIMLKQLTLIYGFQSWELNKISGEKMERLKGYLK